MSHTIYTLSNWQLIIYLFPNGTLKGNEYSLFLDSDSVAFKTKLDKLRRVSEYLADVLACYADTNVIVFVKGY